MESPVSYFAVAVCICILVIGSNHLVLFGHSVESPQYAVIRPDSDFEVRLYRNISWISSPMQGTSFEKSTKDGFHRIYQYIHGANANSSQLPMTAPVLTSIIPSQQGLSSAYYVRLFIPPAYYIEGSPPLPNPELNLQLDIWGAQCIAVRKFSGFAKDDNIPREVEALLTNINESFNGSAAVQLEYSSYSIAQYNASRHLTERLNEVWMYISGLNGNECQPRKGKY